ncbi:MAG: dTDP-4-dehydrorhamnose reductase [Flavobacteriaceae bacterium]|nr:dTDP-4-dehydrorhamnose reductase [Flavobacteriaceae bacterium]
MINVLVTGAHGQLARTIALSQEEAVNVNVTFKSKKELDTTNKDAITAIFHNLNIDFCINCAAYTNVDQAEKSPDLAYQVNADAVKNLAEVCEKYNVKLIHISTDYVFDGNQSQPYLEEGFTNPLNTYGKSKLKGEHHIQKILESYYIIRTSWLYSAFENNFFNTICKCLEDNKDLNITIEQIGTPTSCLSLARYLLWIVTSNLEYGIYHFSDDGEATWFDFALEIAKQYKDQDKKALIKASESYPTIAKRPVYSVLDNTKRKRSYAMHIDWRGSINEIYQLRRELAQY